MRGFLLIALVILSLAAFVQAKNKLTGINLSGAAFASGKVPGRPGYDYFFPTEAQMDYFLNRKMNVVRFPILWERIQPSAKSPLDTTYSSSLLDTVKYVTGKGQYLIVDVHNYQSYFGETVGESSSVTADDLLDLYEKLYTLLLPFKEKVIWGIMNEPLGKNYQIWLSICQSFINKMRKIGCEELLLIPGLGYTGAGTWGTNYNYHTMWNLTDPLNNFAMELHMYHDSDGSGTSDVCVSPTVGAQRMRYVTNWMRNYGRKAFMGEMGAGRNKNCYDAITTSLQFMSDNDDVWLGWTWWAGGPGWGSYIYTLTPYNGTQDPPQWPYITPFIADSTPTPTQIENIIKTSYPHAGNINIPIYNGALNMMSDSSWATNITRQNTDKFYSSLSSYSFIPGGTGSNAMQWICSNCFDTTLFEGLEFYIYTTGSLANLQIRMIDYASSWSAVGNSMTVQSISQTPDKNGWAKCFLNFSNYDGAAHDGFMIWSSSARPLAYLDAVSLIHHLDKDLLDPTFDPSPSTSSPSSPSSPSPSSSPDTGGDKINSASSFKNNNTFFGVVVLLFVASFCLF